MVTGRVPHNKQRQYSSIHTTAHWPAQQRRPAPGSRGKGHVTRVCGSCAKRHRESGARWPSPVLGGLSSRRACLGDRGWALWGLGRVSVPHHLLHDGNLDQEQLVDGYPAWSQIAGQGRAGAGQGQGRGSHWGQPKFCVVSLSRSWSLAPPTHWRTQVPTRCSEHGRGHLPPHTMLAAVITAVTQYRRARGSSPAPSDWGEGGGGGARKRLIPQGKGDQGCVAPKGGPTSPPPPPPPYTYNA